MAENGRASRPHWRWPCGPSCPITSDGLERRLHSRGTRPDFTGHAGPVVGLDWAVERLVARARTLGDSARGPGGTHDQHAGAALLGSVASDSDLVRAGWPAAIRQLRTAKDQGRTVCGGARSGRLPAGNEPGAAPYGGGTR